MINDILRDLFKKVVTQIRAKSIGIVNFSKDGIEPGEAIVGENETVFVVNDFPIIVPTGAIMSVYNLLMLNNKMTKTGAELDSIFDNIIKDLNEREGTKKAETSFNEAMQAIFGKPKEREETAFEKAIKETAEHVNEIKKERYYTLKSGKKVIADWDNSKFHVSTIGPFPADIVLTGQEVNELQVISQLSKHKNKQ